MRTEVRRTFKVHGDGQLWHAVADTATWLNYRCPYDGHIGDVDEDEQTFTVCVVLLHELRQEDLDALMEQTGKYLAWMGEELPGPPLEVVSTSTGAVAEAC